VDDPLGTLLFLFGIGFLAANLSTAAVCVQDWRRRSRAVLTWRMPPRFEPAVIGAVCLGLLIVYKLLVLGRSRLFGEAMMLTYYGTVPLSGAQAQVLRRRRPPRPRSRGEAVTG
jgi:hypothetical protein